METEPNNNTSVTPNGNSEGTSSNITVRMIMQGKEAGSIIGKKGDNVKKFREESGAKINISDASCPERIVTVTGVTDQIIKAFSMICQKFEDDIQTTHQNSTLPKPPVTVRLIVPASQCGSLIGKGGSKIKEIREVTGASIQVASEMLPNSTERAVTISGTADSITQSIYHICSVMIESPPKGATIPYRPKPAVPPVIFAAGGQAYTMQGQYAIPQPDMSKMNIQQGMQGMLQQIPNSMLQFGGQPQLITGNPLSYPHQAMGAITPGAVPRQQIPNAHAAAAAAAQAAGQSQSHEMTIPNDLIGCIIGRGGSKINEIRQLSGANIKIANQEDGSPDRRVTIMGMPESINAAQYLINASLEMHKQLNLDPNAPITTSSAALAPAPLASLPLGVSPLLKPMPLVGLGGAGIYDRAALTTKLKGGSPYVQAATLKKDIMTKFSPY